MQVDQRLNDIDDCLYRVAVRVLLVKDNAVLVIKESAGDWWALPGGGVDHGETIEATFLREIEEELGIATKDVSCDFQIAHYNIGAVVNGVPRMNLYFKASVPAASVRRTDHVAEWKWLTKDEFLRLELHASFDKAQLAAVIFADKPTDQTAPIA